MAAYYNEHDKYAAQWLRNLISAGHIAAGEVDDRSISDVAPNDLVGFTQCHFFAGIGVWSDALRLAGWPDDKPVWTGSCPCQPFSVAGKGDGVADERHLWPHWFHLIEECRPGVVFGEQVEAAIKHGWLDLVQDDMEGIGYAVAPVGIPAAGVGAPHIRQRLFFVADANQQQRNRGGNKREAGWGELTDIRAACELADVCKPGLERGAERAVGNECATTERGGCSGWLADMHGTGREPWERHDSATRHGNTVAATSGNDRHGTTSQDNGFWSGADWLRCRDGKWRPVEPGTFPLAHRPPARVGRLCAYGNAIVTQVAAEMIKAYMDCRP